MTSTSTSPLLRRPVLLRLLMSVHRRMQRLLLRVLRVLQIRCGMWYPTAAAAGQVLLPHGVLCGE